METNIANRGIPITGSAVCTRKRGVSIALSRDRLQILDKAVEYGHIERNPVSKRMSLQRDRTVEDVREWWTPDDEAKALGVLATWRDTDPLWYFVITLQLITGLRFSEVRVLEKGDLDLRAPGLWVRRSKARKKVSTPKNKKARFAVSPRGLADELHAWMLRTEGQLLFPGPTGGALANNTLNRAYARLAAKACVRRISSHGARHTAGSGYAYMGAGSKGIATVLGHSDMASTERYTHMRAEGVRELVEARWKSLVRKPS